MLPIFSSVQVCELSVLLVLYCLLLPPSAALPELRREVPSQAKPHSCSSKGLDWTRLGWTGLVRVAQLRPAGGAATAFLLGD